VGEAALINMEMYAKFEEFLHHQYTYNELQKSKALLDDPNVELMPHDNVMARLRERREARSRVIV